MLSAGYMHPLSMSNTPLMTPETFRTIPIKKELFRGEESSEGTIPKNVSNEQYEEPYMVST